MSEMLLIIAFFALIILIIYVGASIIKRKKDYEERLNAVRQDRRVAMIDDLMQHKQRARSLDTTSTAIAVLFVLAVIVISCC